MLISVVVKKYYKMFHKQNTVQGSDTTMFNSSTSDGSIIKNAHSVRACIFMFYSHSIVAGGLLLIS